MVSHDQLFKELLEHFFADLLHLVVPGLEHRLEPRQRVLLSGEVYADRPGSEHKRMDLVVLVPLVGDLARTEEPWSGPAKEGERHLLVHVEVEARYGSGMGRRMLRYARFLARRHRCPVLSIVVYLKGGPVGVEKRSVPEGVEGELFNLFHYWAVGLSGWDAASALESDRPLAWALAALMRRPAGWSLAQLKVRCLNRIARADLDAVSVALLIDCVDAYLVLSKDDEEEIAMLLEHSQNQPAHELALRWTERMRNEGRNQALRDVVLRLLGRRFGVLPGSTVQRVEAIDSEDRLQSLVDQVLDASSLAELGLA